jgi:hypothetical protein
VQRDLSVVLELLLCCFRDGARFLIAITQILVYGGASHSRLTAHQPLATRRFVSLSDTKILAHGDSSQSLRSLHTLCTDCPRHGILCTSLCNGTRKYFSHCCFVVVAAALCLTDFEPFIKLGTGECLRGRHRTREA